MKNVIRYEFCDGVVNEYEVDDKLYAVHESLVQEEKHNHKRETRRHVSLNYLNENGIDFEDTDGDCLTALIRREDNARLKNALSQLLPAQRELVEKIFFEGKTITGIAKDEGVVKGAVANRLTRIFEKLKKLLN